MKIQLLLLFITCYNIYCESDESDESDESNESDESSDEYENDNIDGSVFHRNIFVNKNTSISLLVQMDNVGNSELVQSKVNNIHKQTMYTDTYLGIRVIIPKDAQNGCLIYYTVSDRVTEKQRVPINTSYLVAKSVKKCHYQIKDTEPPRIDLGPLCKGRQMVMLDLIGCYPISATEVTIRSKNNKVRRAACVPLWESYRIETTCLTIMANWAIIRESCYTKTEYFTRTFCLNNHFGGWNRVL